MTCASLTLAVAGFASAAIFVLPALSAPISAFPKSLDQAVAADDSHIVLVASRGGRGGATQAGAARGGAVRGGAAVRGGTVARGGTVVLQLPKRLAPLANERLVNRLRPLGRLVNLEPRIEVVG